MSKSAGTNVQKTTQNSQTGYDPGSADYMHRIWNAAQAAGAAGPSPLVTGAADYNSALMKGGSLGASALAGDTGATQTLMNPYQGQVIDAANNQWNVNDAHTMNDVDARATAAGAFGGSRHGVATGVALGENNRNRNAQVAGLLQGGFNDAMTRAGTLAGMGYAGAGANANLGMGGVGSPELWMLNMLKQGWSGPTGTTSSGANTTFGAQTSGKFTIPGFG